MAKFAFGYFDGSNFVAQADTTITTTPTRYSYTFTTPTTIGGDAYVGVFDSSDGAAETLTVSDIMLNEGALRSYATDTPTSNPLGAPGVVVVSYTTNDTSTTESGSFIRHHTGILIPDSTKLASQHTNTQLFEQFVPFPVQDPSYDAPIFDAKFTSSFSASVTAQVGTGRGSSSPPTIVTSLDAWNDGADDPNVYVTWANATATGRYFKPRITMLTSSGQAPGYITSLAIKLTSPSLRKIINNFNVDAAGTALNFPNIFHSPPNIQCTPSDGNATSGGASNITSQSAFIELFKGANEVGGVCNLVLEG